MSFIFISHASEDKRDRVRPLVEVLIREGEPVWLDRPGSGEGNFGFDQSFISRNDIDHLQSGNPWSLSIQSALRESGAVLGCLSRGLMEKRTVLAGELTVADSMGKLLTCIVDDIERAELPRFSHGLLDLTKSQSIRIDPTLLRSALDRGALNEIEVEDLPESERVEWEKVRNLIADINRVRREPRSIKKPDFERLVPYLEAFPIGPMFNFGDLPSDVLHTYGDHLNKADRCRVLLAQANSLVAEATADQSLRARLRLREGSLPPIGGTSGDNFWTQVFREAGMKARRVVAALLVAPAGEWALEQSGAMQSAEGVLRLLAAGHSVPEQFPYRREHK